MVDVRKKDQAILVFVDPETDQDDVEAVKVLAKIEWPERAILVARRTSIKESGAHAIHTLPPPPLDENETEEPSRSPSDGDDVSQTG